MNEQEIKDNFTQLWLRMVAAENRIDAKQETPVDLTPRVATLEEARKKQIELNTQLLHAMKANPDKAQTPSAWWKKLW